MSLPVNGHMRSFRVEIPWCACVCEIDARPNPTNMHQTIVQVNARLCLDDNCKGRARIRRICDKLQAVGGIVRYNVQSGRYLE